MNVDRLKLKPSRLSRIMPVALAAAMLMQTAPVQAKWGDKVLVTVPDKERQLFLLGLITTIGWEVGYVPVQIAGMFMQANALSTSIGWTLGGVCALPMFALSFLSTPKWFGSAEAALNLEHWTIAGVITAGFRSGIVSGGTLACAYATKGIASLAQGTGWLGKQMGEPVIETTSYGNFTCPANFKPTCVPINPRRRLEENPTLKKQATTSAANINAYYADAKKAADVGRMHTVNLNLAVAQERSCISNPFKSCNIGQLLHEIDVQAGNRDYQVARLSNDFLQVAGNSNAYLNAKGLSINVRQGAGSRRNLIDENDSCLYRNVTLGGVTVRLPTDVANLVTGQRFACARGS